LQVLETPRVACHEGCHCCCYLKVSVTAPEVLALAQFIETELPRAERERIAARAAELAADPRIFSEYAKPAAKIPCALLTDAGACAAYAARPLACRGWNSTDADSCRRALADDSEPIPMNPSWARECAAVGLALRAATTDAGFSGEILELTVALDLALRTPNALERWIAGAALFAAARA
jgi:Fe-S-cluster containining protein